MTYSIPRNLQPYVQRVPAVANLLLVIFLGLACARLFWLAWPVKHSLIPVAADSARQASASDNDNIKVDQIAAANLFGEQTGPSENAATAEVINAPETQLNLVLTGIVASSRGHDSRALIKDAKNEQKPYAVGDTIIDNVKLHAIYSNRVILDRNGRYETLTLEQEKTSKKLAQKSSSAPTRGLARSLGQARAQILRDPSKAAQYLRIQPQRRNGKLAGYRIYPGSNRSLFQKAGLRPGELVTAINGQSLDNPSESLKLLGDLSQASSVTVTLERGGQTRTMTVNFQ